MELRVTVSRLLLDSREHDAILMFVCDSCGPQVRADLFEGPRFPFPMLANRLFGEPIEPSRLRVGLNLTIPGIVEIDLVETLEELGLVSLRQLLNRFDDFAHRAHMANLAESFSDRKRQRERKKCEWI